MTVPVHVKPVKPVKHVKAVKPVKAVPVHAKPDIITQVQHQYHQYQHCQNPTLCTLLAPKVLLA